MNVDKPSNKVLLRQTFACYLANHNSNLVKYLVEVDHEFVRILSAAKGTTKSELQISTIEHIKEICELPKESPSSEHSDVSADASPSSLSTSSSDNSVSKDNFFYPAKLMLPNRKSRTLYCESPK